MIKLTPENTTGKIASYLLTYKELDFEYGGYEDYCNWFFDYYKNIDSSKMVIAFDIETKKLYPIGNEFIMFAVTYKLNGKYISKSFNCRDWSKEQVLNFIKSFNKLKSKKVLHNAYFDITTLAIMFGEKLKWDFDTYIIFHNALTHRAKDSSDNDFGQEKTGLSLKDLTRDFLNYGDYEEDLNEWKKQYCRDNKIKVGDFTYDLIPEDILAPYNCMDTTCTLQLFEKGMQLIKVLEKSGYKKLRENIKMKHEVTDIYMDARIRGIYIDRSKVRELNDFYKNTMEKSKNNIYNDLKKHINYVEKELYYRSLEKELMKDFEYIAEHRPKVSKNGKETWVTKQVKITDKKAQKLKEESKINFNSSQHKAMLFVESMGLAPLEKSSKTNAPKCDIKFMEHHVISHPELQSFLDYGKCRTAMNNFLGVERNDGEEVEEIGKGDAKTLWELTSDDYPYIHSNYNLNGTVTHRCSCNSINLQQIPSRSVLKHIKECISSRENNYFVYSDFASAEVCILGSIINSKVIHDSLVNKWDLHSMNAWKMLKEDILRECPELEQKFKACGNDVIKLKDFYAEIKDKFEQTIRYRTKSLVFSLAYGTTAHGVSKNLGTSKKEAQQLIDRYLDANPEMKLYIKNQHLKAKKYGYVETPFGNRILLADCMEMDKTNDRKIKMRGEKQLKKALNVPIQNSNAIILYHGLIRAKKLIKERGYEGKINFLFSVYDSFCYEVHESVPKDEVLDILERSFCCYLGDFYLGIDSEIGYSWGETEAVKRDRRKKEEITNYNMSLN